MSAGLHYQSTASLSTQYSFVSLLTANYEALAVGNVAHCNDVVARGLQRYVWSLSKVDDRYGLMINNNEKTHNRSAQRSFIAGSELC